jgi:hypothetical protein
MVKFPSFQQFAPYIFWHIILGEKKERERERERGFPCFRSQRSLLNPKPTDDEKSNFFDLEENYDDTEKPVKFGQPSVLLCV